MDIEKEIAKHYKIKPYQGFKNCWQNLDGDCNGEFITTIFKLLSDGTTCIYLTARDYFDEQLCKSIFELIDAQGTDVKYVDNVLTLVDGLNVEGYPFEYLAISNGTVSKMFEFVNPELDRYICQVAPIARCELIGKEDQNVLNAMFHHLIDFPDWKRDIAPRILMRYQLNTGSARKYKLYDRRSLTDSIDELTDEKNYKIEVFNFKEQYIKIDKKKGPYRILAQDKKIYFQSESVDETLQWVVDYLTQGLS